MDALGNKDTTIENPVPSGIGGATIPVIRKLEERVASFAEAMDGRPFSIAGFRVRNAESFVRAECDIEAFRARQGALNAVRSQEGFTFEFQSQCDVQQVEPATAKPFSVFG